MADASNKTERPPVEAMLRLVCVFRKEDGVKIPGPKQRYGSGSGFNYDYT